MTSLLQSVIEIMRVLRFCKKELHWLHLEVTQKTSKNRHDFSNFHSE